MTVSEAQFEPVRSSGAPGKREGAPTPCPLFRRVQKRDATIVDFSPEKIVDAIFRAAVAVGGKDRRRAEVLSQYVILDLAEKHQESTNLLHIEQIQDSIERILMEHGHYRTARAFITYRNERARRRAMKGEGFQPAALRLGHKSLSEASVWTSSGERVRWDREQIVKALVRETHLSYEDARRVSYAVEMEIIHSKISHLTAPLIRELTNVHLLQLGFEAERRLHSRLGLPVYDVEQLLLGQNAGSNGDSIESEILRQFAMEKVLPVSVSEAHGRGDIHVHDLEGIHRVIEKVRDLDLGPREERSFPRIPFAEETEWDRFIRSWESEEHRLLGDTGKTLIWNHVNSAIAFHAQAAGMDVSHAIGRILESIHLRRAARPGSPTVVWRLNADLDARWRGRFIGARQLSLLPEDELDTLSRCALLEILRRAQEMGPSLSAFGLRLEVVTPASEDRPIEPDLLRAIAECMNAGAPIRVFFDRDSTVGKLQKKRSADLVQVVSLNFPRAALAAEGSDDRLGEWLEDRIALIAEGCRAKKALLERLGALSSRDEAPEFGIGVWGLLEMTHIHLGKDPRRDDSGLKWLLEILARVRLRLNEIGERNGLTLSLVQSSEESLGEKFSAGLPLNLLSTECGDDGSLLRIDETDLAGQIAEGKIHSLLRERQATLELEYRPAELPEETERRLAGLAAMTHVIGAALTGIWSCCNACGARSEKLEEVCMSCGAQDVYRIERRDQGKTNRIESL